MLETTDNTVQYISIEPPMMVDELSSTEIYIGTSKNDRNQANPNWRIKRIWKLGSVWRSGFPDGNQDFVFIWDDRFNHTYS